jgi:peptide/nickel transport system permease protein
MTTLTANAPASPASASVQLPSRGVLVLRYLRRNKSLVVGILIVLLLMAFSIIGSATLDTKKLAYPLGGKAKQAPSVERLINPAEGKSPSIQGILGSDFFGADLAAAMARGLWQTAMVGVLAGGIGTMVGVVLGFISAFYGGAVDTIIKGICQILQPIPVFLIQVLIASSIDKNDMARSVGQLTGLRWPILNDISMGILIMASVVALLAWMGPTLVVRSQVLSMKERQFVSVARLSGMTSLEIIFKEILPNLLPFIAASFIGQVFGAIFASFGLSVLGLGPMREPLIGNILYYAQRQAALFNDWWWWPLWPSLALVLIFGSLTLINIGLDEVANPRLRRSE